jgi:hypothetical protein
VLEKKIATSFYRTVSKEAIVKIEEVSKNIVNELWSLSEIKKVRKDAPSLTSLEVVLHESKLLMSLPGKGIGLNKTYLKKLKEIYRKHNIRLNFRKSVQGYFVSVTYDLFFESINNITGKVSVLVDELHVKKN